METVDNSESFYEILVECVHFLRPFHDFSILQNSHFNPNIVLHLDIVRLEALGECRLSDLINHRVLGDDVRGRLLRLDLPLLLVLDVHLSLVLRIVKSPDSIRVLEVSQERVGLPSDFDLMLFDALVHLDCEDMELIRDRKDEVTEYLLELLHGLDVSAEDQHLLDLARAANQVGLDYFQHICRESSRDN